MNFRKDISMKRKKEKVTVILFALLCLITGVVIYLQHTLIPFMMDDIWYQTKLSSDEPISSFKDIIDSQIWHYNNWGGRSIAHGLLQLILLLGEPVADVLNVIVTFVLAIIISKVADVKIQYGMFGALAMLFGFNPNWRMSMFWQSGAANYLYMSIFILLFLYCYIRENSEKRLYGITFWIIPLGLFAGWSNENVGPTLWCISLIAIAIDIWKKKKVEPWMILGNISCFLGSVLMILAPGNYVRTNEAASNEYGFLWNLFLRSYSECKAALEYLFPLVLITILLAMICKGILQIKLGRTNSYLLLGALLSWGAMILSPHYPDRATFGTMVFLICAVLSMMKKICIEKENTHWWFVTGVIFIWLGGMFYLGEDLALIWGWIR